MPVYEIVLREPRVPREVSFTTRAVTSLGDLVIVGDEHWVVVDKEPPFGLRRIEPRLRAGQARTSVVGMSPMTISGLCRRGSRRRARVRRC